MSDIQNLFGQSREDWLDSCRDTARKLLRTRLTITIEDVLEVCPRPNYLHRNTTGKVFQDKDFKAVGFRAARKASSHGRTIRVWGLKNPESTPLPQRSFFGKEFDTGR